MSASYDTDVTTFSPAGRLFQVEYACQAVNQGSPVVGLRSNNLVVLAAIRRRATELESYAEKVFKIDEHLGVGIAGLNADGRVLHRHMRNECLNHRYVYEAPLNVGRLASHLGHKAQKATQSASKRPYGVGMLLAGADKTGPKLFEFSPSGSVNEFLAMAIGGRAQSAKTYLERHFEQFSACSEAELVSHALSALTRCLEQDGKLTKDNVSVAVVGTEKAFTEYSAEQLQAVLDGIQAAVPVPMEI